jgi:hypothetical protein
VKTAATKPTRSHSTTRSRSRGFFNASHSAGFFSPVAQRASTRVDVQTKLSVSKAADPLEKQADRTADQVIRMPEPVQRATSPDPTRVAAPLAERSPAPEPVQRFGVRTPNVAADAKAEIQHAATGGQALSSDVRSFMQPRLGANLSDVRVHTDESAASLSNHLSAQAFTYRNHVFFGRDQYQPGTTQGRHLLAHELTHTIQQGATVQRKTGSSTPEVQRMTGRATPDVRRVEAQVAPPQVASGPAPAVQRLGIQDALNYFADKANYIPGFRMLTLVIGFNPINLSRTDRTAANFLRALIELVPGGALITRVLDTHGVINQAAEWVGAKVATLGDIGSEITGGLKRFIASLSWTDIFNLGDVWDRAKRIFGDPIARLITFGTGVITELLSLVKQAILRPLAALAAGTRGYDLLKAVLAQDPITGDPYPRTAETLIGGFMKLIGQEEVWENLKRGKAVQRAWAWFQGALSGLMAFVTSIPGRIIETLRSLTFGDVISVAGAFAKVGRALLDLAVEFGSWALKQVLSLLEILVSVVAPGVMPYIAKAKAAFQTIVKDPIRFVGNLVRAGKLGFQKFAGNILEHLKTALINWLVGPLAQAGVYIPKSFSLLEIVKLVLSVLGLTWQNIRGKLVKIIPEPVLTGLEKTASILVTLVTEGPAAAWDQIVAELTELKDQLISQVTQMIQAEVVKAAVAKLVMLLNPAGAVVQAILAIWNTVSFFIEKINQIGAVVASFIDSVSAIASGQVENAAKKVEQTMANTLVVVIGFLAKFAGLGGIPAKLVGIVQKIRAPIDKALDKIVGWLGKMLDKLKSALSGDSRKPTEKERDVGLAKNDAQALLTASGASPAEVQARLPQIKTKYKLTSIALEQLGDGQFDVLVVINPTAKTSATKLAGGLEGLAEGVFIKALGKVWRIYAKPDQQHIRLADVATLDKKTFSTPVFMAKFKAGEYVITNLDEGEDPTYPSKLIEEHAQETKTPGHRQTVLARAVFWAKKYGVKRVHMDRQYRTISVVFKGTIVEERRGDVVIEHVSGRIDVEEIRSISDKPAKLKARNLEALALLPPGQGGDVEVIKIEGVAYPEDKKAK